MKGQKDAVVEYVKLALPGFRVGQDVAIAMLSYNQLEELKVSIARGIEAGEIDYSKNQYCWAEVRAYARSMVMNHLKKAKELNGSVTYGKTTAQVAVATTTKSLRGIDFDLLTEDLSTFVKTLV